MASICVHRAPRTPPDIAPGHISSRDVLLEDRRTATDLPRKAVRALLLPGLSSSYNSSDKLIAILRASRAHPLARWHRFVSIERREPLQTALQGILTSAMFCRKIADLPRTALRAGSHTFLQFTWQGNRHSTGFQGTSARAMASICVHRASRTPPDSAPGHIPVPGGTKLGSPGPFSVANCLIINDGRCQVNFTKARFDSIRPVENLSKDDCGKPTLRSGASSPLSERELTLNGCTFVRRIQALFWYAL